MKKYVIVNHPALIFLRKGLRQPGALTKAKFIGPEYICLLELVCQLASVCCIRICYNFPGWGGIPTQVWQYILHGPLLTVKKAAKVFCQLRLVSSKRIPLAEVQNERADVLHL